jgi:O-methyltransferase involved in polyketide biosynthesis
MDKNKDNVAVSALYTAGTWQWARLSGAELVTPAGARSVFRVVNLYMTLYRLLNPSTYSLRHQLLHRHAAIDHLLAASGCQRTIEVGCGFSPRGARVSADPGQEYIEVDLPDMVIHKRRQLEGSASGRSVLARKNFRLHTGDIVALDFAQEFRQESPVPRTAVVTEGLMMYFTRDQQLPIWRSIARLVSQSNGVYLFDYIPLSEEPGRSLLGRLLHAFRVRVLGIKGDFAYDQRDRHAVAEDLVACGFEAVESFATTDVAKAWGFPQADARSRTIIYCCRPRLHPPVSS